MKVLVINGPNLNMLGIREPNIYGNKSYKELVGYIRKNANELKTKVKCVQSNYEGKIVAYIQKAYKKYDGIIINAGAYSHTSIAILDALKAVNILTVEVHLSNIQDREDFRKQSFLSLYADNVITGKGVDGYIEALKYLIETLKKEK